MTGDFLHVAERDAGVEGRGNERVPQGVRPDARAVARQRLIAQAARIGRPYVIAMLGSGMGTGLKPFHAA